MHKFVTRDLKIRVSAVITTEIVQKMKHYPDGRMDVLTRGQAVFRLLQLLQDAEYHEGVVEYLSEELSPDNSRRNARIIELLQECHILLYGQAWPSCSWLRLRSTWCWPMA